MKISRKKYKRIIANIDTLWDCVAALEEQNDHLLARLKLAGDMIGLTPGRTDDVDDKRVKNNLSIR